MLQQRELLDRQEDTVLSYLLWLQGGCWTEGPLRKTGDMMWKLKEGQRGVDNCNYKPMK